MLPHTRLTLLAAAATAFAGCSGRIDAAVTVTAPEGVSPRLHPVLSFMETQMTSCGIPGAAIAVVQDGSVVDQAGLGARDGSGSPVDPSTLFFTAALSKVVDGIAALSLAEQGKLDPTQPVTSYIPLLLAPGFDPKQITVSDLLAGTSGLPDVDDSGLSCAVGAGQLGAWFASNPAQPLWAQPGSVWNYSQRAYAAAGWVLERVSGEPVETAMESRVFRPGGMTTATYDASIVLAGGDYAVGHEFSSRGHVTSVMPGTTDCAVTRAADGVYASVLDYAHLAQTLLSGGASMLNPASVARLEAGQGPDGIYAGETYGYGLYDLPVEGHTVLHVQGDMHGFDASLILVPDMHFAVAVFFNADRIASGCRTDDAAGFALHSYLGFDAPPPYTGTVAASGGAPYVGTYFDPYALGTIDVTATGATLTATTAAYGSVTLTQLSATAFQGTFGPHQETVTFGPGASGPAGLFVTRLGVGERQ
jgi:CubicO group peptidase (beta-lactamase class C family)